MTTYINTVNQESKEYFDNRYLESGFTRNMIVNPDGEIAQQGTAFTGASTPANNDDTYLLDQWILLSDTNDVVDVSQETTIVPAGSRTSMKLLVAKANKKFGILQPLLSEDTIALQDKIVSIGFQARTTAGAVINNLRATVLSWDGAADTITSDVVSAWNATGTDPTLVANWTKEIAGTNLALGTTFTEYKIENITIDTASTNNVALFIWCDDASTTANDVVYISQIRMNLGSQLLPYRRRSKKEELDKCKYFFERIVAGSAEASFGGGVQTSGTTAEVAIQFQEKRSAPTVSYGGNFEERDGTADFAVSNITGAAGVSTASLLVTHAGASGAARGSTLKAATDATAYIQLDSRL